MSPLFPLIVVIVVVGIVAVGIRWRLLHHRRQYGSDALGIFPDEERPTRLSTIKVRDVLCAEREGRGACLPWASGSRRRRWSRARLGRDPGIGSVTCETLALPMAKEASREPALGRVLIVLSNRAEDARKLFSLALAKRKSHQAGPARADRVRPRAAIPIGGLLRPG